MCFGHSAPVFAVLDLRSGVEMVFYQGQHLKTACAFLVHCTSILEIVQYLTTIYFTNHNIQYKPVCNMCAFSAQFCIFLHDCLKYVDYGTLLVFILINYFILLSYSILRFLFLFGVRVLL